MVVSVAELVLLLLLPPCAPVESPAANALFFCFRFIINFETAASPTPFVVIRGR
jgi:hypothetical protein